MDHRFTKIIDFVVRAKFRIDKVCFLILILRFISLLTMTCPPIKFVDNLWTYSIQKLFRENAQQEPGKIE